MYATCTRRHVLAGTVALALTGIHAGRAQEPDDPPGVRRRTFTSNFSDHELSWSRDWDVDPFRSEVREEDGVEHIYVVDQTVAWNEGPTQVQLILEPVDDDFSPDAFIDALPDDAMNEPGLPDTARVFGKGDSDRGAWMVYGWEPIEDRGNVGGATVVQYLFPEQAGDPLVTIAVNISGTHVDEEILERADDEVEFDGESVFILVDHDEAWELIDEVF